MPIVEGGSHPGLTEPCGPVRQELAVPTLADSQHVDAGDAPPFHYRCHNASIAAWLSGGRPDRESQEIGRWAREHDLPYGDGHVHFPDARIEYEDRDGLSRHEDLEIVTGHYRGAHAGAVARSGFSCYRAIGGMVGGCASTGRRGGSRHRRLAEELLG